MIRMTRLLIPLALLLVLGLRPSPARAQTPNSNDAVAQAQASETQGNESSGDPMYGYVATGFLVFGVMFVVCKSSRR
jgi:hypothetical protein